MIIRCVLANPCEMEQYDGIKEADDLTDAAFLARLARLEILPTGYIYPRAGPAGAGPAAAPDAPGAAANGDRPEPAEPGHASERPKRRVACLSQAQ